MADCARNPFRVLCYLLFLSIFITPAQAIEVSGIITENTLWDNTSEPYIIDNFNGPVVVASGVKLTIANGATVTNKFDNKGSLTRPRPERFRRLILIFKIPLFFYQKLF